MPLCIYTVYGESNSIETVYIYIYSCLKGAGGIPAAAGSFYIYIFFCQSDDSSQEKNKYIYRGHITRACLSTTNELKDIK